MIDLKRLVTYVLLSVDIAVFAFGGILVFTCLRHITEGEREASASIAHVGSVAGSPHLVSLFLGIAMMLSAAGLLYKTQKGLSWSDVRQRTRGSVSRLSHSVTESGREIASLLRKKRSEV